MDRDLIIQFVHNNIGTLVVKSFNKPTKYIDAIPSNKDILCGAICGYDEQNFNIIIGLTNSQYGFKVSECDAEDILFEFYDSYVYISYEFYKDLIYGEID